MSFSHSPRITVIIPVYNREKLLLRCLDSIAEQDYRPVRVVMVDNASTDGTRRSAAAWAARHDSSDFEVIVTGEPARGASDARVKGFEVAFGATPGECEEEPVSFFDSDDVMCPGMLTKVMETFAGEPETELMIWRLRRTELDGRVTLARPVAPDAPVDMHLVHSFLGTIRYALRAGLLRRAGGWRRGMMEWDDWELGVRLLLERPHVKVTGEVLAETRCQADSITGTDFASRAGKWERALDMVDEVLARSGRSDAARLRRVVAYRRVILAAHYAREGRRDLARPLLRSALESPLLSGVQRVVLRWAYGHTALGLRGAYTVLRPLL